MNREQETYIYLLDENLPTCRNDQKHLERDYAEGTYDVKFITYKENPNTNRNKGRISIGEIKFITYDIYKSLKNSISRILFF